VDIPWPRIALVLPFAIPFGDGACLTNQVGWTQQHSFFVFVYGALLVAFVIRMRGNRFGKGSIERKETYVRERAKQAQSKLPVDAPPPLQRERMSAFIDSGR
jgi:hypothetical protein